MSAQSNHGSFSIIVVVLFVIIFYFLNLQFVPDRGTLGFVVTRSPLWINLAANTDNFQPMPMMASTVTSASAKTSPSSMVSITSSSFNNVTSRATGNHMTIGNDDF